MSSRKRLLFSVFGMAVVLGYATVNVLSSNADEIQMPLPPSLSNLTAIKTVEIKDAGGHVVLRGTFGAAVEKAGESERDAELTGTGVDADATGKAEIEISSQNSVSQQEFEIEVSHLDAGSEFRIFVDGQDIAGFRTDTEGKAEIEFTNAPSK